MGSVLWNTRVVPGPAPEVALRRDARRNHERLVAAARELFASEGIEVAVREVARRAEVGMGTLYRHFPTRDDLVDAVLADAFEELAAIAGAALAEPDAWTGFRRFLEEALLLHARNRGLKEVLERRLVGKERAEAMRRRIEPLVGRLVARAQEQGRLRLDFKPEDVALLFWGGDRVIELSAAVAPQLWRRYLGFLIDGLQAQAATPLEQAPLTRAQLRRVGCEKQRK
jgi:AcrR family transcriptional regulator